MSIFRYFHIIIIVFELSWIKAEHIKYLKKVYIYSICINRVCLHDRDQITITEEINNKLLNVFSPSLNLNLVA